MVEQEYAKALWDLALEENKTTLFRDYFALLQQANTEDFYQLMKSPSIGKDKKKEVVKKVFGTLDETFVNFLYVLVDHNRYEIIDDIGHQYRKHYRVSNNTVIADIYSSKELTKKQVSELQEALKTRYNGKTIEMKFAVDPELLSGVRIVCNGESVDINLRNSLEKLRETM